MSCREDPRTMTWKQGWTWLQRSVFAARVPEGEKKNAGPSQLKPEQRTASNLNGCVLLKLNKINGESLWVKRLGLYSKDCKNEQKIYFK